MLLLLLCHNYSGGRTMEKIKMRHCLALQSLRHTINYLRAGVNEMLINIFIIVVVVGLWLQFWYKKLWRSTHSSGARRIQERPPPHANLTDNAE